MCVCVCWDSGEEEEEAGLCAGGSGEEEEEVCACVCVGGAFLCSVKSSLLFHFANCFLSLPQVGPPRTKTFYIAQEVLTTERT